MTQLHLFAGNTPTLLRLLESGGIASVEDLASREPAALADRIAQAAAALGMTSPLTPDDVARLITRARKFLEFQAAATAPAVPAVGDLDLAQVPEAIAVAPAAPAAPAAIPVRPAAAPAVVNRPAVATLQSASRGRAVGPAAKEPPRKKFRDFNEYVAGEVSVDPLPRRASEDEEEVEGALKRFNYKPGEPVPRLVRRGVPHPRPFFLVFCSLIVLASRLLMLAVIVGTPVVLWPAFAYGETKQLIAFLWVIGAWLLSCLFYLVFALRARCRVCTNQIFWSKRCFKNQKAHRVWGLGLVGSLALHALLFGWFRCMYCGTAIRLKFTADPERSK